PSRNAQRYFTKYNKLKTSVEYVNEQLTLAQSEADYLANILAQIELAAPADIQDIRLELQEQGYLKQASGKKKVRKPSPSQPAKFTTTAGSVVLVGKNNRQNDELSFKTANKDDLWFHVKDLPGSHVILKNAHPSEEEIIEVAQLAAYYSKGRNSSHVQVDYLSAKNLHKPNGAKPGFVTFRGQTTISVTPRS
ncbi:MAG: NFACT RNA binding domain-containing protein, partial [Limosilactobacillus sp.]|nr:NFACT RNA binding domain-containing protein [Limosilactobacillus sp.]